MSRSLFKKLSRIAWEVLSLYYINAVNKENVLPAAVDSIQIFGDLLGFIPHLHILYSNGCFGASGNFLYSRH
jgi:hypothetical protein